jgi:hypothetical protein
MMKKKDRYNLDEAIKEFYITEPLRRDFAAAVADKAFANQKNDPTALDKILIITLGFVTAAALIYGFSLLSEISVAAVSLFVITIAGFIVLSIKEHLILLKRINNQGQNAGIFY